MPDRLRWKSNKRRSAAQRAQVKSLNLRRINAPPSTTTELPLVPPENHIPDDTLKGQEEEPVSVQTDRKRNRLRWNSAKRRSAAQKAHLQSLHLPKRNSLSSTPPELAPFPSSPKNHPSHESLDRQTKEPCEAPLRVTLSVVEPQSPQVALRQEVNGLPSEPIVNTAEGLTTVQNRSRMEETSADGSCSPDRHAPIHASPVSL